MNQNIPIPTALAPGLSLRISSDEIDEAIAHLQNAFTEGRLSDRELEERIEQALKAKTAQDLSVILFDLKPTVPVAPSTISCAGLRRLKDTRSLFSDFELSGSFLLPTTYSVSEIFGSVVLDLSQAKFESLHSSIHLSAIYGKVHVIVDRSVRIQVEGTSIMGDIVSNLNERDLANDGPFIQIIADQIYGGIKLSS